METYTLRGIQSMLGISRSVLSGLIAAGFVTPDRGPRREYRFTFQDVVLLRTALSLQRASIAPRKIIRSLRRLKATLPDELPLSGLRITAVGNEIAVSEGETRWHVDSGQLLLDFEVKPACGAVTLNSKDDDETPSAWFDRALELEGKDRRKAEAAYRRAVEQAPDHVDACLNLGVLLCDDGRCAEAVELYRRALHHRPREALLHFNLGVALEDLGRAGDALASYDACLQLTPQLADAHYNAARLHEQLGHSRQAIRHYSEYRRLQR